MRYQVYLHYPGEEVWVDDYGRLEDAKRGAHRALDRVMKRGDDVLAAEVTYEDGETAYFVDARGDGVDSLEGYAR